MVPPKQLDPTEQDALVKQIGLAMLRAAPEEWDRVTVDYRAVGRYSEADGEIVYADDEISDWPVPSEITELFAQLRAGMYRDGRGTWFNATYRLDHPSSYNLDYDREEPDWRKPPPPQAYADDLQSFPRTGDNIPEWLLRRVQNQPAELPGPRFRVARIFDGQAGNGKPLVHRPTVPERDRGEMLDYLNAAPVVSTGRGMEIDRLDPEGRPLVPVAFHTDGSWIWPAAVNYYLHNYGVSPELELVEHIRRQGFQVPDVDEATRAAAAGFLGRGGPVAAPGPMRPPVPALRRPPPGPPRRPGEGPGRPATDASPRLPGTQLLPDAGAARLPAASTQLMPGAGASRLPAEGPPVPHNDASPRRPAAASTQLMPTDEDGGAPLADSTQLMPAADGPPRAPKAGQPRLPGELSPRPPGDPPRPPDVGPPPSVAAFRPPAAEPPRSAEPPRPPEPARPSEPPRPSEAQRPPGPPPAALPSQGPPSATIDALRSRLNALGVPASAYRIGPPAERAWTMDQTPDGWRVGWYEREFVAPAIFEDVADAAAFLLGKIMLDAGRPATPEPPEPKPILFDPIPVPVDEETVRADPVAPEPQPAPAFAPAAPPPAAPPLPAAARSEARAEPESRHAAQPAQQRWPIQPLSGEPPLTLFRGKRMLELAPGTELDRFGNPDGNLTYAAGTRFTERSLVPDWIERPYHTYRVERPTQALSGTAIPWFEQEGGGTAYVLPESIETLLANGTLTELPGRPRPMG